MDVPPSNIVLVHLGLGEQEEALNRLEEAVDARDLLLTFLTVEPRWADLAGHPRFTALLEGRPETVAPAVHGVSRRACGIDFQRKSRERTLGLASKRP